MRRYKALAKAWELNLLDDYGYVPRDPNALTKAQDINNPLAIAIKVFREYIFPKIQNPSEIGDFKEQKSFFQDINSRFSFGYEDQLEQMASAGDLKRMIHSVWGDYNWGRMIAAIQRGIVEKDRAKEWNKVVGSAPSGAERELQRINAYIQGAGPEGTNLSALDSSFKKLGAGEGSGGGAPSDDRKARYDAELITDAARRPEEEWTPRQRELMEEHHAEVERQSAAAGKQKSGRDPLAGQIGFDDEGKVDPNDPRRRAQKSNELPPRTKYKTNQQKRRWSPERRRKMQQLFGGVNPRDPNYGSLMEWRKLSGEYRLGTG